jgi:IS5 family transposase
VEEMARFCLRAKYFLGIGADGFPRGHSMPTAFKGLPMEIVALAGEQGIQYRTPQVVDSVHTVAGANAERDDNRGKDGKPPRDPSAGWEVKHSRRTEDAHGKSIRQKVYFYGYKGRVGLSAETGYITSALVTPGNAHDGGQFSSVLERGLALGLPVQIAAADQAHDDKRNHYMLEVRGVHAAIRPNDYRSKKKDKGTAGWLPMKAKPEYISGRRRRYQIGGKFGEAKEGHGLGRCRYVGFLRYAIQLYLAAVALSLKRMVKLLAGVSFKGRARATG